MEFKMNKTKYNQICSRINDRILGFLKDGIVPWQKPWKGGKFNAPRSVSSGKLYRGTNLSLLGCAGYESPWWLTFGQAKKLGGQVIKGQKSFPVSYWKFYPKEDCTGFYGTTGGCSGSSCGKCRGTGQYQPLPSLFSFNVFNANQCEGLPEKYYPVIENDEDARDFTPVEACEEIVANYPSKPDVYHDQTDSCHYSPAKDEVHMVKPEKFVSDEEYYSTFFHELVHSTGHKKRLAREGVTGLNFFGSHEYSKEELVAELGSTYLCAIAGIDRSSVIQNSASYISGWKSKLTDNVDWIVWAGSRSAKACDHILGTEFTAK
jgi:antirestriction protein ArdC|tara:strand:- start:100 stop:1056 length:957 start_codon:yes stop_codon:yes gene_type:complete